jgi:hypothetical protein
MREDGVMEDELWEAIKHYGEGMERVILSTLIAVHQGMNVINLGPPGQGKSFCTRTLCDMLKIKYTLVAGHKTPREFFEVFRNEGLVIIDESATLVREPKIMDMLLSALWDGQVEWSSHRNQERITFTGQIIFNTNSIPNNEFMRALKDRCIFNNITLSSSQLKKIAFKENKDFSKEWNAIGDRLNKDAELTKNELVRIRDIIQDLQLKSLRTPIQITKIASFLKMIFGDIDKISLFVDGGDEVYSVVLNKNIKDSEKVKKIATLKNVTDRQARNIFNKYKGI